MTRATSIGWSTGAVAAVCAALAFSNPASAALVSCPAAFTTDGTAKVYNGGDTAASACQYIVPADPSVVANTTNVNAAGFFGFSDWQLNGSNSQIEVSAASGTWTIQNVDFALYDYMITFKDGSGTNLTSFLFNEEFASGDWVTPFTDPPFDLPGASTSHNVSHYSIFQRQSGTTEIPEPGTLGLLGLSLLGLGAWSGRGRKRG